MNFLSPATIAIAAAITIPPLIALYFLKLKRAVLVVPSTLLWKRAVEDLQVNSPFQRLRSSLLLLLQLLVLIAAAIALGKPMFESAQLAESTVIILIDQSASMSVVEADGETRLDKAKTQAKLCVDNLGPDSRAMVIAFCDRAIVKSSFDTDREALKRKIDAIVQTQSISSLGEAMSLAEAHTQNIMVGTDESGSDLPPTPAALPGTVFLFSDGKIEDADLVALERFDVEKIRMTSIGTRTDNIGIIAMDARRNYEHPEVLEVSATVRNFGEASVTVDAVLYVDGENVDIQSVTVAPNTRTTEGPQANMVGATEGSVHVVAFDEIEFEGGGVVEVTLRIDDGMSADDQAWTVIDPPRHLRVLSVGADNLFLTNALATLQLQAVTMTGDEYETAADSIINDGDRSAFDVVIFDRHSTARLPRGNYFFWGCVPKIDGVSAGEVIADERVFNWDDAHPILRHVAVETLSIYEWLHLTLPPDAIALIEGERSPVLSYMTRDASQFLISAFSLISEDDTGNRFFNTYWGTTPDFVMFMQNAVHYLASSIATSGKRSVTPGRPVTISLAAKAEKTTITRPDGTTVERRGDEGQNIHYADTRLVGTYHAEPGVMGHDVFAVNLFNSNESNIAPSSELTLGTSSVQAAAGEITANRPAWPHFLLAILALLIIEWIVYNRRVYV